MIFVNRKRNAQERLDRAESWSGHATLLILGGILLEIALLFVFPHTIFRWELWLLVVANAAIGFGLAIEYVCILGAIKAGAEIKEQSDRRLSEATRIAAEANERAAQLDKDAAQARLQLEQLRKQSAARHIKSEQFVEFLKGKPKLPVEIMFVKDDGEAFQLALEIRNFLRIAKWEAGEPFPIPAVTDTRLSQLPSTMAVGGQPSGVSVATYSISPDELKPEYASGTPRAITPFTALHDALLNSLGTLSASSGHLNRPKEGTLRVIVGSKPHPLN